jgi:CO/xanthine dehydrogenase FAD-binding subunit
MGSYVRPSDLTDALGVLRSGAHQIIAGGTDYYPARVGRPLDDDVLDITALDGLRGIADRGDHYRIGALATWTDLLETELPPAFDGLKLAAREIGGMQIQNAGTICGNICNASPAADGVPNLLVLDAAVELSSSSGARSVPLAEFITGNRTTVRRADELVTAITVTKPNSAARGGFMKLGTRKYLVISIVMVAASIEPDSEGNVAAARIAVGACSPVPMRLGELEAALLGRSFDGALGDIAQPGHLDMLSPIDDVRADATYRRDAALTVVRRALNHMAAMA